MAVSPPRTAASLGSKTSDQDRRVATGLNKNAPDGVTSNTIFVSPLIPNFFRSGAGIVTRPRVENFTR